MGVWKRCLDCLEGELSAQQFNTWIRPLQVVEDSGTLRLLAPNRFVMDWVNEHFLGQITTLVARLGDATAPPTISLEVGAGKPAPLTPPEAKNNAGTGAAKQGPVSAPKRVVNQLNPEFTFDTFIAGKSNELARAASLQVAQSMGGAYNPLFIYGGVGLGKTHLLHAIGNHIKQQKPEAKVVYLHAERFVADMVTALQHNTMPAFKQHYRSVDALLIDDIQFFAGKERTQEEFFHTFNALLDSQHQIILTCDRYPKEVPGLEERLSSRFGWGLTVIVESAELETRVAILQSKAEQVGANIPMDVTFFIARRFASNIRELEGALRRVLANARFTGKPISLDFTKEALKDLLNMQDRQVSMENIQKTVAEYYKIRVSDLLSVRRTRSLARPRQIAMSLAKELTTHSLPEIGAAFGGRDHTTVLHACRKVGALRAQDARLSEDYSILARTLTA